MYEILFTVLAVVLMVWGVQLSVASFILSSDVKSAFRQRMIASVCIGLSVTILGLVI